MRALAGQGGWWSARRARSSPTTSGRPLPRPEQGGTGVSDHPHSRWWRRGLVRFINADLHPLDLGVVVGRGDLTYSRILEKFTDNTHHTHTYTSFLPGPDKVHACISKYPSPWVPTQHLQMRSLSQVCHSPHSISFQTNLLTDELNHQTTSASTPPSSSGQTATTPRTGSG